MMTNGSLAARAGLAGLLLALTLSAFGALVGAGPVSAASSVELQVRALMGGRYEVGGWSAVSVTLVNDGEPTEGNLSAETTGGTVQRFVEMPAGARKVVVLYVQPEAFQRRITVTYQEPNGSVEAEVEVRVLEQSGSQVAIVGDGAGVLRPQVTGGMDESAAEPLVLAPADIPERPEPLAGISSMVWAADSSSLTEGQRRSLERWIADGGELVVVGGADWQARTAAFTDLLPVTSLAAVDDVPQVALAGWSGSAAAAAELDTVSTGPLHEEARALVRAEDGTVLLSMRPVGAGRTILLGADFATEAYRGWEGSPRIWARLLPSTADLSQFFGGGFPMEDEALSLMSQALSNLPSLDVPPAELLLAVIVAYILLIGPVSYLVLRRLDRREAAWITAPILVLVFTACSYGIGNTLKGSDVVMNEIALIRTSSAGGAATIQSHAGIFSPQRSTYDLRVEADALLARMRTPSFGGAQVRSSPVTMEQGNPAQLRDLAIGVYGFEGVRADAVMDYEPALSVTWRHEDGDLIGTVTNTGDETVSDVAYISSSIGEMIGDLAPGQVEEFEVPRTNFNGTSASDQVYGFGGFDVADPEQRGTMMRRQVIDSLVGYGSFMPGGVDIPGSGRGPFLVGWREGVGPLPILVDELVTQRYGQSIEVLSVRTPIGTGEVTIRPAQMASSVIASDGDANSGGPGMMFIGDGSVTFSVTLPLDASGMEVSELTVIIGPDPGMVFTDQGQGGLGGFWPPGFVAEIRDPRSGEWRELGDISQDATFEIEDPASALSDAGRIEVRVTGGEIDANFGQASIFVSAEVSGVLTE